MKYKSKKVEGLKKFKGLRVMVCYSTAKAGIYFQSNNQFVIRN